MRQAGLAEGDDRVVVGAVAVGAAHDELRHQPLGPALEAGGAGRRRLVVTAAGAEQEHGPGDQEADDGEREPDDDGAPVAARRGDDLGHGWAGTGMASTSTFSGTFTAGMPGAVAASGMLGWAGGTGWVL